MHNAHFLVNVEPKMCFNVTTDEDCMVFEKDQS